MRCLSPSPPENPPFFEPALGAFPLSPDRVEPTTPPFLRVSLKTVFLYCTRLDLPDSSPLIPSNNSRCAVLFSTNKKYPDASMQSYTLTCIGGSRVPAQTPRNGPCADSFLPPIERIQSLKTVGGLRAVDVVPEWRKTVFTCSPKANLSVLFPREIDVSLRKH